MKTSRFNRFASLPSLILVGSFVSMATPSAQAGNTWDGGAGSGLWSAGNNWNADGAPGYGTLTFSGSTQTTMTNDSITSMNQLLWTGTSAWTLNNSGGTVLSLFDFGGTQAKIENQSSGLVTINAPITFAANNGTPPNPFGEINAVNGDITFGTGTLTVNGSSVNGIKLFGAGRTTTFNNTVSASGKWFGLTGAGTTMAIGGTFTSGDIYVMNGGTLKVNTGAVITASALRLGGDFGNTGNQNQTLGGTLQFTDLTGGQSFGSIINSVTGNSSNALLIDSLNTSNTNTISGNIFLDSGLRINQASGGTLSITNATLDLKAQTLTLTGAGGNIGITGVIGNSTGAGQLVIGVNGTVGGPTVKLSSANTYSGDTFVRAGTLEFATTAANANSSVIRLGSSTGATVTANLNLSVSTGGQSIGSVINAVTTNGGTGAVVTLNSQNTSNTNTLSNQIALDRNMTITQALGGTLNITQARAGGVGTTTGTDIKSNTLTLGVASGGTISVSGDIYNSTGSGKVNIAGGTVNFSGTNTYTGATDITTNAILNVSSVASLSSSSALTGGSSNSSTTALNLANGLNYTMNAYQAGNINFNATSGNNTLTFTNGGLISGNGGKTIRIGANTTVNINGAAFDIYSGSNSIRDHTLQVDGTLTINAAVTGTNALVSGFTKTGLGTMTLNSGSSTYNGDTKIQAGKVIVGASAPASGNGSLGSAITAIALGQSGSASTDNPTLLTGGAFTIARPITVGFATGSSGSNYEIGGNTANTSSFSGAISLNRNLNVSQVASGTLNITGGVSSAAGRTVTFTGPGIINVNTNPINNGVGTMTVGVTGGNVTFNASNGYTGGTNISGGTLNLGHATDTISSTGTIAISGTGILAIGANSDTVGAVTMSSGSITGSGGTLTGASYAFTDTGSVSAILGGAVNLSKSGAGTVSLTGNNIYTGVTTVSGGVLQIDTISIVGANSALGNRSSSGASGLVIDGGTLQYIGTTAGTTNRHFTIGVNGATIDSSSVNAANTLTLSSSGGVASTAGGNRTLTLAGSNTGNNTMAETFVDPVGGTLGITKSGAGTWLLTTTSVSTAFTGAIAVNQGILQADTIALNGASTANGITFGGGTLAARTGTGITTNKAITATSTILLDTANGAISLGGNVAATASGLTVSGGNFLTLGGANAYAGVTTIGAGGVKISAVNNLGDGSATNTISLGGILNSTAGTYDLGANRSIALTAGGTLQVDAGALTVSGTISGAQNLTKTGSGTLLLTNANSSYSGVTTLSGGITNVTTFASSTSNSSLGNPNSSAASRLVISGATLLHDAANVATTDRRFTVGVGGATIDSSAASATDTLSFTQSGNLAANSTGNRTLTLTGSNTGSNTLNSVIVDPSSGATSLSKTGAGKWVLNGNNTYTGATNVSAGVLAVNGSLANTTTTVAATLQGSGTIGGSVAIQSGGTLAPGNSIESLGLGSVDFLAGSTYAYELNSATFNGDLTYLAGSLDITSGVGPLGTTLTLTELFAGTLAVNDKLTLISYTGGWTSGELFNYLGSTLADDSTFTLGANQWLFNYNDTTGGSNFSGDQAGAVSFVTMTVIPEPNAAMLVGGLGMLALLRRRRY